MHPCTGVALATLTSAIATILVVFLLLVPVHRHNVNGVTDIVAFGDSYTDESRWIYFLSYGVPPPAQYVPPDSNHTATGGLVWPRIFTNSTGVTVHNYAVAGSVCSNGLTPRFFPGALPGPIPSMQDYAIPAFDQDFRIGDEGDLSRLRLDPGKTLVNIWIGTNDLGQGTFLTNQQVAGVTLDNVTDCPLDAITRLYDMGARKFMLMTVPPLWLAPLYAPVPYGVGDFNHYWANKTLFLGGDNTAISSRMQEIIQGANQKYASRAPELAGQLPGSEITILDTCGIMLDIINFPQVYLTPPYNVTGFEHQCGATCDQSYLFDPEHPDGYHWYDEIHPTQRTSEIIAEEFQKALSRQSRFASHYP